MAGKDNSFRRVGNNNKPVGQDLRLLIYQPVQLHSQVIKLAVRRCEAGKCLQRWQVVQEVDFLEK